MAHASSSPYAWTGAETAAAPAPITPRAPNAPDIRVGPNGHIQGVDGMLDQIASALTRHAGPMLVRDVLPAVQSDVAMQERMGAAAGQAMADKILPWVTLGAGALGVLALVQLLKWRSESRSARQRVSGSARTRNRR